MVASPARLRERLAAERELRSATIDFTLAFHTMVRSGADEKLKADADKAQQRVRAAEALVEKLARASDLKP